MKRLSRSFPVACVRGVLLSALTSVTLLSSTAWAQEPPPDEEPTYDETILDEGLGWQLKTIRGTVLDDKTQTYQPYEANVFTLQQEGLYEAPLAGGVQDELLADPEGKDTVFTTSSGSTWA